MISFLKKIIIFSFFSFFLLADENQDLKEIFSEHYLKLFSISDEMIYYKYIFLIKNLKDKVFCDSLQERDEKILIERADLSKKKYFYAREKLVRKIEKGKEEYKYGIGFGRDLITFPSGVFPEENLKNVFIIKKQRFLNCEGENLDKFELSKKNCTEFEFEYYIFTEKSDIDKDFCFKLFSFYDEDGRGSAYFPRRKIKFFSVLVNFN